MVTRRENLKSVETSALGGEWAGEHFIKEIQTQIIHLL